MIQFTKGNGKGQFDKVTEYQYGKMGHAMKVIGKMIVSMDLEHSIIMKVMFILVNFLTVKLMGMAYLTVKMEHNLKVNFVMAKNTALVLIHFLMGSQEWVNGKMENGYNGSIKTD